MLFRTGRGETMVGLELIWKKNTLPKEVAAFERTRAHEYGRQSRPDSGFGFQVRVLKKVQVCAHFARKLVSESLN